MGKKLMTSAKKIIPFPPTPTPPVVIPPKKRQLKPWGMASWQAAGGKDAWYKERDRLEDYEYMRDNLMSLVKNSNMSFEYIHERCGPHPQTLEGWAEKKIKRPQFNKMWSVLQIIGKKFSDIERP
jgi:hypothetical protein